MALSPDLLDALRRAAAAAGLAPAQQAALVQNLNQQAPPASPRSQLDDLITALRQQPGLPIRPPIHQLPPWWAKPIGWTWEKQIQQGDGAVQTGVVWDAFNDGSHAFGTNVQLDGNDVAPQPFYDGQIGILTQVECFVGQIASTVAWNPAREFRWTVSINGETVEGMADQIATVMGGQQTNTAATPQFPTPIRTRMPVPIPLRIMPRDVVNVRIRELFAAACTATVILAVRGYRVPVGAIGGGDGPYFGELD